MVPGYVFDWNGLFPKKVVFVAWRVVPGRLPTSDTLKKRYIPVSSTLCPICGEVEETVEHVLVSCGIVQTLWSLISLWCKTPDFIIFCVRDLVELHKFFSFRKEKANLFNAICLVVVWCL
ncbi:uncharacterized protein LOC143625697 [Bidens hawaiensis]|uniref:uncharacterized protein LOC143625697 n=1 Tax=Bidens hawaiensis TaxID=980011 RepID=UPI004049D59E